MKVAVLGLGEAGSLIAKGLADQGIDVVGFDPIKQKNPVVTVCETAEAAVTGADIVLSLNSATVSIKLAQQVATHLKAGSLYCDLNTGTPSLKKRLGEIIEQADNGGVDFVDVAVMKPVPGLAEKVPLSVAGSGARRFAEAFSNYDLDITYVSAIAGEAAARKLIRSILAKGMAAIVIDALWAAKSMGLEEWAFDEIRNEFDSSSRKTVQRYLDGTQQHSKRRSVEMADVVEMLSDANYESTMVSGVELTLSRVIHGTRIPYADAD